MEKTTAAQQGLDAWEKAVLAGVILLGLIIAKVVLFGG